MKHFAPETQTTNFILWGMAWPPREEGLSHQCRQAADVMHCRLSVLDILL